MYTSATDEDPSAGIPSPGTLLAAKRNEYGWSVKDVAGALRLSMVTIEAIERGEHEKLPGKTYILGYWNSYAQLLEISIDESIEVHRKGLASEAGGIVLEQSHQLARGREEKSRKLFAMLFAVLLAGFLTAVWHWQNPDASLRELVDAGLSVFRSSTPDGDATQTTEELPRPEQIQLPPVTEQSALALPEPNFAGSQQTVEINTRGYEVLITDLPISRPDLTYKPWSESPLAALEAAAAEAARIEAAEAEAARIEAAEEAAESLNSDIAGTADTETGSTTAAVDTNTPSGQSQSEIRAEATRQAQAAAAARAQTENQSVNPESTGTGPPILFQVDQESWVDVRDSTGERLIYRTVNSGERITLSGSPPYSVFLGSAEGVDVEYQGEAVAFGIHESGLFARFIVGDPQ